MGSSCISPCLQQFIFSRDATILCSFEWCCNYKSRVTCDQSLWKLPHSIFTLQCLVNLNYIPHWHCLPILCCTRLRFACLTWPQLGQSSYMAHPTTCLNCLSIAMFFLFGSLFTLINFAPKRSQVVVEFSNFGNKLQLPASSPNFLIANIRVCDFVWLSFDKGHQ